MMPLLTELGNLRVRMNYKDAAPLALPNPNGIP